MFFSSYIFANPVNEAEKQSPASDETEWTMGLGLGAFQYHLYPGAKNKKQWLLPVPYFTFRSPRFEIDRGIKSFLFDTDMYVIDISADFGLPINSGDTQARKGMPDLDFVLQLGPSIEFFLTDKNTSYFDVRFELPARVAYVVDGLDSRNIGYLLEPRLSFNHRREANTGLSHKVTVGLKFATEDFHAYYYDVAPQYATGSRSAYESEAGFGGSFAKYRITYKTNEYVYWAFLRYQSLHGAVFEDSPLVLTKDYYLVGVGFAWIFASSL